MQFCSECTECDNHRFSSVITIHTFVQCFYMSRMCTHFTVFHNVHRLTKCFIFGSSGHLSHLSAWKIFSVCVHTYHLSSTVGLCRIGRTVPRRKTCGSSQRTHSMRFSFQRKKEVSQRGRDTEASPIKQWPGHQCVPDGAVAGTTVRPRRRHGRDTDASPINRAAA